MTIFPFKQKFKINKFRIDDKFTSDWERGRWGGGVEQVDEIVLVTFS